MAYTPPTVVASGTTFAQFQSGGPSGQLEKLITAQAATVAPTVAHTWTENGGGSSGGAIAAGTYYSVVTECNGFGETTKGPESTQITVTATHIPRITFQSLKTGNTSRNIYIGAVGGATGGPYTLYASGITAATYDLAVAAPTNSYAMGPPTVNTTALTYVDGNSITINKPLQLLRAIEDGDLRVAYQSLREVVYAFNSGQPVSFGGLLMKLRHAHACFAMLSTLCSEMGTLIDANAGTISTVATPIGTRKTVRTWP